MRQFPINAAVAAGASRLGLRLDPLLAYNFVVEIDGLLTGGFTSVAGLDSQVELESYREGGVNGYVHQFPKGTGYSNLVLTHGLTASDFLWAWYRDVTQGKIKRRNCTIMILNARRLPTMWWTVKQAYPVKWSGPSLKADQDAIAFEQVELVHQGIDKPRLSRALAGAQAAAGVVSAGL